MPPPRCPFPSSLSRPRRMRFMLHRHCNPFTLLPTLHPTAYTPSSHPVTLFSYSTLHQLARRYASQSLSSHDPNASVPSTSTTTPPSNNQTTTTRTKPITPLTHRKSPTSTTTTHATTTTRKKQEATAVLTLTPAAVKRLQELSSPTEYLKVGTKQKGCTGQVYTMDYVKQVGQYDEVVEQDGVRVVIDGSALMSLIGSEMDWVVDPLSSGFVFSNPNVKEMCGCGQSFMT